MDRDDVVGDELPAPLPVVVDHDPRWRRDFENLTAVVAPAVAALDATVEHVGSTAVDGLAAKPVIDLDVVVATGSEVHAAVDALVAAGWTHEGDLGIPGREAFRSRPGLPAHHLYVVVAGSRAHRDHVLLRDHLRAQPHALAEYAALKRQIDHLLPNDRPGYLLAKSALIRRFIDAEERVRAET